MGLLKKCKVYKDLLFSRVLCDDGMCRKCKISGLCECNKVNVIKYDKYNKCKKANPGGKLFDNSYKYSYIVK